MNFFSKLNCFTSAICIFLCSFFFTLESASAQTWVVQNSGTTADLLGVFFIDVNNGWAVGGYWDQGILHSTIVHTINGGNTWQLQNSNANAFLYGVTFADQNQGWACGVDGVMLHTTNGGSTWVVQNPGTEYTLMDVTCVSPNEAWAVGQYATILHTTDSGNTWTPQVHPLGGSTLGPRKVVFHGPNLGWAFGEYYTVFRTTNGGQQWTYPGILTSRQIMGGDFADDNYGWAVGSEYNGNQSRPSLILRTTNGGQSWSPQSNAIVNGYAMDAAAIDSSNAWIAGYTGIFRTTNGGATWVNQQPAGSRRNFAICRIGNHNAWAVGELGTIRCYRRNTPVVRGSVTLVSSGPPDWNYRLNWISGSISRFAFTNVCPGTIGSVTGDAARFGWRATNYSDSIVFTTSSPLAVGNLSGFHLIHPTCSDFVTWNAGDSSGVVDGPLPIELTGFEALAINEGIRLRFELASETNNDHFEIWRGTSSSGVFTLLAEIPSRGNSSSEQSYEFTDHTVIADHTYWYFLADVDVNGNRTEHRALMASATANGSSAIVSDFSLSAYPNPFNPNTIISFSLPETHMVRLSMYNVSGRIVRELAHSTFAAGSHQIVFDGSDLPTGVYVARISIGEYERSAKLLLIK